MIIDASVAFKWIVSEPDSEAAMAWIERTDLVAPALVHAEVGNALWKRIRKGELSDPDGAAEQLLNLERLVRTIDETPMMPRALDLAVRLDHPVYDCVYLAMAEALDDQLLTADRRFLKAVRASEHAERVKDLSE